MGSLQYQNPYCMVILIVDSSGLITERIANLLSESGNPNDVYRAVSYEEADKLLEVVKADIILLDIFLPENRSLDLLKKAKEIDAETQIIMLTSEAEIYNKARYQYIGAALFLDKYHEFEKIPVAIDTIMIEKNILPG